MRPSVGEQLPEVAVRRGAMPRRRRRRPPNAPDRRLGRVEGTPWRAAQRAGVGDVVDGASPAGLPCRFGLGPRRFTYVSQIVAVGPPTGQAAHSRHPHVRHDQIARRRGGERQRATRRARRAGQIRREVASPQGDEAGRRGPHQPDVRRRRHATAGESCSRIRRPDVRRSSGTPEQQSRSRPGRRTCPSPDAIRGSSHGPLVGPNVRPTRGDPVDPDRRMR